MPFHYSSNGGNHSWNGGSMNMINMPIFCEQYIIESYLYRMSLRKHAYSNILKILPSKNENFQIKNSDIFHISAQSIDCGYSLEPPRQGGSNEYPQSML